MLTCTLRTCISWMFFVRSENFSVLWRHFNLWIWKVKQFVDRFFYIFLSKKRQCLQRSLQPSPTNPQDKSKADVLLTLQRPVKRTLTLHRPGFHGSNGSNTKKHPNISRVCMHGIFTHTYVILYGKCRGKKPVPWISGIWLNHIPF